MMRPPQRGESTQHVRPPTTRTRCWEASRQSGHRAGLLMHARGVRSWLRGWKGTRCPMADSDSDSSDALQRARQTQAQSKALREQVAALAEAVAATEQESARVHKRLAEEDGPLAAKAREHAARAEEIAAKERVQAERLRGADHD
jgi:hypothetical protein